MSTFTDNVLTQAYADIRESNGTLRFGQAVYNRVHAWDRQTAKQLDATEFDPFYDDARVTNFLAEVDRIREERK